MNIVLVFGISLSASVIGAICGIGGGVIIKPLLDSFQLMSVTSISFLSGCTVLSMSAYSVLCEGKRQHNGFNIRHLLPISFGSIAGGILGKALFHWLTAAYSNSVTGFVQSSLLIMAMIGVILYTTRKHQIQTLHIENGFIRILVGLLLGGVSAFLGIGGGPFNLVALSFFFSTDDSEAAISSLLIIFVAQVSSLVLQLATRTVPDFSWPILLVMAFGGIIGGIIGRRLARKINTHDMRVFFVAVNALIILICLRNVAEYFLQIIN